MHKHFFKLISALGLTLVWLMGLISMADSAPAYQTVPTMPPPTSTPTATSTSGAQPTSTRVQPTATSPRSTSTPATQTAQATATQTGPVPTTRTPPGSVVTPPTTQPGGVQMTPIVISAQTTTQVITPTASPTPARIGGGNLGLYGLIGAGVVVILACLILLWTWVRRKQPG